MSCCALPVNRRTRPFSFVATGVVLQEAFPLSPARELPQLRDYCMRIYNEWEYTKYCYLEDSNNAMSSSFLFQRRHWERKKIAVTRWMSFQIVLKNTLFDGQQPIDVAREKQLRKKRIKCRANGNMLGYIRIKTHTHTHKHIRIHIQNKN